MVHCDTSAFLVCFLAFICTPGFIPSRVLFGKYTIVLHTLPTAICGRGGCAWAWQASPGPHRKVSGIPWRSLAVNTSTLESGQRWKYPSTGHDKQSSSLPKGHLTLSGQFAGQHEVFIWLKSSMILGGCGVPLLAAPRLPLYSESTDS